MLERSTAARACYGLDSRSLNKMFVWQVVTDLGDFVCEFNLSLKVHTVSEKLQS